MSVGDKLQLALSTKERIRQQLVAKGCLVPEYIPFSMYPDIIEFGTPDEVWSITGKSNEDADRTTVKNLTGNGNNLVLTNFRFAENSGYGDYVQDFNTWYTNVGITKTSSKIVFPVGFAASSLPTYNKVYNKTSIDITLKVQGSIAGLIFKYRRTLEDGTISERYIDLVDGVNRIVIDDIAIDNWVIAIGFSTTAIGTLLDKDIIIEQIPEYEGYLVTDGVDDKIISGNFELGENWTMVGDWKMLDNATLLPVMLKSSSFVFEYINGVFYMCVRNPITSKTVTGVNSIKAICSDGRIYLHDGTEIIDDSIQTYKGEISPIYIGTNKGGTKLSKIAFKSLSIYKDKILTKEQCIRAYDYLQTLKAK